jgi:maleylacetoacetate isomerase/maleylpyruvate isomerase
MRLHAYFRSSTSYRLRIALNLKGLDYEVVPVDLRTAQQKDAAFTARNPFGSVPMLEADGRDRAQSMALLEWLDEAYPQPPLLPAAPLERAYVRALALGIACEIHPLNNLRVLRYLVRELKASDEQKNAWYRHWVEQGLAAIEARLVAEGKCGRFALGDAVTLADVVIVPQIFNAQRFDCRLEHVPTVMRIFEHCMELPAFVEAQPARQPDAE